MGQKVFLEPGVGQIENGEKEFADHFFLLSVLLINSKKYQNQEFLSKNPKLKAF